MLRKAIHYYLNIISFLIITQFTVLVFNTKLDIIFTSTEPGVVVTLCRITY